MNERIKKIRKNLDLTQHEFAEKIGLKQNSIALIESGKRNISDRSILSICREFKVNEIWLRTGDGDMFEELSQSEKLADFFGQIASGDDGRGLKILMQALANLGPEYWEQADKMIDELLEEVNAIKKDTPQGV